MEGLLICLTRLQPKVSLHIPAPAVPLPSPRHGAARKEKGWGGEGLERPQEDTGHWGRWPGGLSRHCPDKPLPTSVLQTQLLCHMSQSPGASVFSPVKWVNP